MVKILTTAAAAALFAGLASASPAAAAERHDAGIHKQVTEFSSQHYRRHHRYVRRYVGPRYYGGYAAPYYGYGYGSPYYRPYYGPSVGFSFGPFGFGVW
jgi:hypothetical protein